MRHIGEFVLICAHLEFFAFVPYPSGQNFALRLLIGSRVVLERNVYLALIQIAGHGARGERKQAVAFFFVRRRVCGSAEHVYILFIHIYDGIHSRVFFKGFHARDGYFRIRLQIHAAYALLHKQGGVHGAYGFAVELFGYNRRFAIAFKRTAHFI